MYQIPAALSDPLVIKLENLRAQLHGAPPAYYIKVTVDNRRGVGDFSAGIFELSTDSGRRLDVITAGTALRRWAAEAFPNKRLTQWFDLATENMYSGEFHSGTQGQALLLLMDDPLAAPIKAEISNPDFKVSQRRT